MKNKTVAFLLVMFLILSSVFVTGAAPDKLIGVNVVLNTDITDGILADLAKQGKVRDVIYEIDALTMQVRTSKLATIKALPYVVAVSPDAVRNGAPVGTVLVDNFANGLSTWDQDAINATDFGFDNRQVDFDGAGVYVAVLDTGLLDSWRQYFPEERIAEEYGIAFGGGGGEVAGKISGKNSNVGAGGRATVKPSFPLKMSTKPGFPKVSTYVRPVPDRVLLPTWAAARPMWGQV